MYPILEAVIIQFRLIYRVDFLKSPMLEAILCDQIISKRKMSMKKMNQALVAVGLFSMSSLLLADSGYKIYIDAGSSGSRIHLFQYETVNNGMPVITEIFSEDVKPGVSSFINTPQNAGASLKKLFDDVSNQLQSLNVSSPVPVNLFATAGMRLFPIDQQGPVYANIVNYIKTNYSLITPGDIETIPGKMEGLYGWLDVNYLAGNFQNHKPTLGTLDMGGASTQIVFETNDNTKPDDEISVNINGDAHHVWSKSFLGLGQDQARANMGNLENDAVCYPDNYPMTEAQVGHFNFSSCQADYTHVMNHLDVLPVTGQSFIAFSGAYYAYSFFEVDKTPDQATVESKIQNVCSLNWDDLQKKYPTVPAAYLAAYCANGTYIDDLFYNQYHVQGAQLNVATQVNGKDIDWPLGAVLYSLVK